MLGVFHVIEVIRQVRMKMQQNSKNFPVVKDVKVSKRNRDRSETQTGDKMVTLS